MLQFDPMEYPFPSRRMVVYARRGMVACTHPVAAEAGLRILEQGGNAIDAAVAVAAAISVVEPGSNGIGGDNFALIWKDGKLHGMNSSGFAPKALTVEAVKAKGHTKMPMVGWEAVTVPGAPSGWAAMNERFGALPFEQVLTPAIEAVDKGYTLSGGAAGWHRTGERYHSQLGELAQPWIDTFTPGGKPRHPGEVFRSPQLTRALTSIAQTRARSFYEGEIAQAIAAHAKKTGGYITMEDLAAYKTEWVEPIGMNYRGYDVWEIPPNGQGIVALMALNILKGYEFPAEGFGSKRTLHLQMEALKLAFVDAFKKVGDPRYMDPKTVEEFLSPAYGESRRAMIGDTAHTPEPVEPPGGGTVYFAAADTQGNMVSMIQSNFAGFGSGVALPEYGITFHNRGTSFVLTDGAVNRLEPFKKPYHTIIPGFLTKDGKPVGPFGVMGGHMQPQGHTQVIMNSIDFHMNPQAALDAPRFRWERDMEVSVETGYGHGTLASLQRLGHRLNVTSTEINNLFGRGQIIWRTPDNTLIGGTEPRSDGTIYCW